MKGLVKSTLPLFLALWAPLTGAAATWFVSPLGDDGNAGTSWPAAFKTISNGVEQAADGDVVLLASDTHAADGTGIDSGLYSGFARGISMVNVNKGVTIRGASGDPADTIIDGGYPTFTNRLFYINHSNALLAAVTLTNGFAVTNGGGAVLGQGVVSNCVIAGNIASNHGGGLYLWSAAGTVTHCRVHGNISSSRDASYYNGGGGIYLKNGGVILDSEILENNDTYRGVGGVALMGRSELRRCVFTNNAGPYGAALSVNSAAGPVLVDDCEFTGHASAQRTILIYAVAQPVIVTNCRVHDNAIMGVQMSARNALITACVFSNNTGGGVNIWTDPTAYGHSNTIANSVFVDNTGATRGSGIFISGAYNVVTGCWIQGNTAMNGGGIATYYTYVTNNLITHCTLVSNRATDNGGGIMLSSPSGPDIVQFCRIMYNTATNDGGGVRAASSGGGLLRNNLIVSNTAGHGGGVRASSGNLTNESCTLAFNHARGTGGGMYLSLTNNAVVNCIIVSNTAVSQGPDIRLAVGAETNAFQYCCTPGITNAAGQNIDADPQWVAPDAGNFRLAAGSACIHAGVNQDWMLAPGAADMDGRPRLDRFSRQADMGAYEYIARGTLIGFR